MSVCFEAGGCCWWKLMASRLLIAIHVSQSTYEHGCVVQSTWGVWLRCLFWWTWLCSPNIWNWWWWRCSWNWQQWWQQTAGGGCGQWTCWQVMFIGHKDPPPPPSLIDKTSDESSCSSTWGQHVSWTLQEQSRWASVVSEIETTDYTITSAFLYVSHSCCLFDSTLSLCLSVCVP